MNGTKKDIDPAAEIVEEEDESTLPEVEDPPSDVTLLLIRRLTQQP